MTREKMLEIYNDLLDSEVKSMEEIAKTIGKMSKSRRLVSGLTEVLQAKKAVVDMLTWMAQDIKNHQNKDDMKKTDNLFGVEAEYLDDGIVIDKED